MEIFDIASFIGTVAFALSGFLLGVRKDLDMMGLFIVSMLTANGGGVVRDVLVNRPPGALLDTSAFLIVCGVMLVAIALRLHRNVHFERRAWFVISDSVGLVAFSITGAMVGIQSDLSPFGIMTLAFITATGGGIIRDMIVNELPTVFASGFYGSVALLIGLALWTLDQAEYLSNVTIAIVFVAAFCIRMMAYKYSWHLPKISSGRE